MRGRATASAPAGSPTTSTSTLRRCSEHLSLTLVVAVDRVCDRVRACALLAHRRRWSPAPIIGVTGALYTVPSVAAFLLLLPITGRGNLTASSRCRLHAADPVPQHHDRAAQRAAGRHRRRARDGADRQPDPAPGRAAAGHRRRSWPACGSRSRRRSGSRRWRSSPAAAGWVSEIYSEKAGTGGLFKSNVVVAGGLAVLLAALRRPDHPDLPAAALPWRRVSPDGGSPCRQAARTRRSSTPSTSSCTRGSRSPAACASAGRDELADLASSTSR